jgi:hypothetical protein
LEERRLGMIADSDACADEANFKAGKLKVIHVCLVALS